MARLISTRVARRARVEFYSASESDLNAIRFTIDGGGCYKREFVRTIGT